MVNITPESDHVRELMNKYFLVIGKVIVNKDLTVSVDGSVTAKDTIQQLPVSFKTVTGSFTCSRMGLTTLTGAPRRVKNKFVCDSNQLTDLKGAPKEVKSVSMLNNPLTSLEGLPEHIPGYVMFSYDENLPLLGTLGAQDIWPNPDQVELEAILKQFAGTGKAGAIKCAVALVKAGYKGNARW